MPISRQPVPPVEALDTGAKTYLAAINAAAIYVSIVDGVPASVGAARDLDKALRHLQAIISPRISYGWVAWATDYGTLVDIAQTPGLLTGLREDGVWLTRSLALVVHEIEAMAQTRSVTLTSHQRTVERANVYAKYLDEALAAMQASGELAAFNRAYKAHRIESRRRNESVTPYWAVMQELRAVVIRALIANKSNRLVSHPAIDEIRKHFPWFARAHKNGRTHHTQAAIDKAVKTE